MARYQIAAGGLGVPLIDPDTGKAAYYPEAEAIELINKQGWVPTTVEAASGQKWEDQRSSALAAEGEGWRAPLRAGVAGAMRGATFGGSDALGRALAGEQYGIEAERLKTENPWASGIGEVAGAVGSAFIPGSQMALLGKGGAAVGAATKAAVSGGKAGAAARAALEGGEALQAAKAAGVMGEGWLGTGMGAAARGLAEGSAFGLGSATSEVAASSKPVTGERIGDAIGHGLLYGALLGGGASLGIESVAGAGKWALSKVGLGKKASALIEQRATQAAELEAAQAAKAEMKSGLEAQAYKPAELDAVRAQAAEIEAKALAHAKDLAKVSEGMGGAAEEDVLGAWNLRLGTHDRAKARLEAASSEQRNLLDKLRVAERDLADLGPAPKPSKAPRVDTETVLHDAESKRLEALRSKTPGVPPIEDRLDSIIARVGEQFPDVAAVAAGRESFEKKLGRIWKAGKGEAEDGVKWWDGPNPSGSASMTADALDTMERRLGLPVWPAGKEIAATEYKVFTGKRKISVKAAKTEAGVVTESGESVASPAVREQAQQRVDELSAALSESKNTFAAMREQSKDFLLKAGEERMARDRVARLLEAGRNRTGEAAKLEKLKAQLEQQDDILSRIKALEGQSAEEAAASAALQATDAQLQAGKGGLVGRIARAAATRSAKWSGARTIADAMGGGTMRQGGIGAITRMSIGYEVSAALAPRLVKGLESLIAPTAGTVSRVGETLFNAGKAAGRVLAPGIKAQAATHLTDDEFKAVQNDLAIPLSQWETTARAALMGEDETIVTSVVTAHARQRAFLDSKMPRDPRLLAAQPGSPAIPLGGKWKPSSVEKQVFAQYVRAATHWRNAVEDLVARRATPETMEALQVCYPEVHQALRSYVANGVRKAAAQGKRYGESEARMIDLVLGPPYQLTANVATFQATFAQQKRVQPSRGAGTSAITLSKSLANQLQQGQPGLGTR